MPLIDRTGQVWTREWKRSCDDGPQVLAILLVLESTEIYGGSMHRVLDLETGKQRSSPEGHAVPWDRLGDMVYMMRRT